MEPNKKAAEIIKALSTIKLIFTFISTGHCNDKNIPTVRGWLMDELERRNPAAFFAWLDQDNPSDDSLLLYF